MTARFKQAIGGAGGFARAPGGEAFTASIQPDGFDGDGHAAVGDGFFNRFTLYTEYNDATSKLRGGDTIEYGGKRYRIKNITTHNLHGDPLFRQGTVILETEEDAL